MSGQANITQLLGALSGGDTSVVAQLAPLVYDALRGIAHNQLRYERANHTLNTTALVHEAYLKLVEQPEAEWENRAHFYAVAAQAMRRILVDYARKHRAQKRGGGAEKLPLDEALVMAPERAEELLALDEALAQLETLDARHAQIVEYRFFGGLTIEETANVLNLSPATVKRDWTLAKAWLHKTMSQSA